MSHRFQFGHRRESLAESGARNYLTQEPYDNIVVELLAQMGIEYISKHGGFNRPIFRLIQDVVRQLTDDELFTFARVEEKGRIGFEIYVYTAGSRDRRFLFSRPRRAPSRSSPSSG